MLTSIKQLASSHFQDAVAIRRHLHRHPELSFKEVETAAYISARLSEYGIEHQTNISGNGIVGHIYGNKPQSACIALRAELDALPITENANHNYGSVNTGVMHACGHDAHAAMLLTAARILQQIRSNFQGTVKLIFQPAEEVLPGGALGMMAAGALKNPDASVIMAQHVLPSLESGTVGFRPGAFMASGDEVNILVKGSGGHAAMPESLNDTVLAASQIVVALQQIASRLAPPAVPTVLSFGRIIAEGLHNIIPNEVLIQGTFRTFDEQWRKAAKEHIVRIAENTARALGCTAEVRIDKGYPFLVNDQHLTHGAMQAAIEYLGSDKVVELDLRMTTEDFAHYSQQLPACFYRLGTANKTKGITAGLHTAEFDIDEESLETGSGLMAWLALSQLSQPASV